MAALEVLDLSKLRELRVHLIGWPAPVRYTCYDLGNGVKKEEGGWLWAHVVSLVRHPKEQFEPTWIKIAILDHVAHLEEAPWFHAEPGQQ